MIPALIAALVLAADPKPEPEAVHLDAGEIAPFDGDLIPFELGLPLFECVSRDLPDAREALDVTREAEKTAREALDECRARPLPPSRPVPFYAHAETWLVVVLGIGAGVALGLALD